MSPEGTPAFLVVDDSSTMRRIIRNCLGKAGYQNVTEAADGADGLAKVQQQHFDCILADWNMPVCDGLEMVRRLRKMPGYEQTPVIMVTTEAGKEDVVEALSQGVNSYVVKPFTPEVIKQKILSVLH